MSSRREYGVESLLQQTDLAADLVDFNLCFWRALPNHCWKSPNIQACMVTAKSLHNRFTLRHWVYILCFLTVTFHINVMFMIQIV